MPQCVGWPKAKTACMCFPVHGCQLASGKDGEESGLSDLDGYFLFMDSLPAVMLLPFRTNSRLHRTVLLAGGVGLLVGAGLAPAMASGSNDHLAQSFGTPAPGYGGPYPSPKPLFPGQGPYPGATPFQAQTPAPTVAPAATPPANISFPAPGVICDQVYKLCYNRQGVSQPLSATTFGQAGFASAMLAIQRGLQKQFLLSNGTLCDVSVSACWSDGMGRRIPSPMMSSQLFYSVQPGFGVNPGSQSFPGVGPGGAVSGYANCRLQQGFQVLYNGQCQLMRQQDGNRYRFNAQLGNGMVYSFVNRNGSYRIRDNNGAVWPVSYTDQGRKGVFNWAGYALTLTQQGYNGGTGLGRSLDNLLESLFQ